VLMSQKVLRHKRNADRLQLALSAGWFVGRPGLPSGVVCGGRREQTEGLAEFKVLSFGF